MFDTKKDVDKHVRASLAKLRTDTERNLRGYTVAKLYYKIGEYSSALQYATAYLSVKNDAPLVHRFQGQCYEKLGKTDKALQSYQISLQLNNNQPDLLGEVCKLLIPTSDTALNPIKARYWCQMADKLNVQNEDVLNLKLKMVGQETGNPNQVEELLLKEIISRPLDVTLRIRLLEHYMEQNRISDAFSHASEIESKQIESFSQSLDWYNTLANVMVKHKAKESNLTSWPHWLMSITTIERQLFLTLCSSTSGLSASAACLTDCTNLLLDFDQALDNFARHSVTVCPEVELAAQFLGHFRGQLCLHTATLLFKREQLQSSQQWKEATRNALPLLLLAYNCGTASTDEAWLRNNIESRRLVQQWSQHAAFRCSQAGRTLISCLDDIGSTNEAVANIRKICSGGRGGGDGSWSTEDDLIAQIRQFCSNSDWRKQMFKFIFKSNNLVKQNTSYFVNSPELSEPIYVLPCISDLEKYEEIAQWLHQSSLPLMVYLTMEATNLADVNCSNIFKGLNFSTSNLLKCGAETLNQLDIDSFLYATTLQAKRKMELKRIDDGSMLSSLSTPARTGAGADGPSFLPYAILINDLCTDEQRNWWTAAYKVYKNQSGDEIGEIRTTLQHGIEAVRAIGGPKIDLMIALRLGKIFQQRAHESIKVVERGFLEARAEAHYKYSLQFIKVWNNRAIEPCPRFFRYAANGSDAEQKTNRLVEDAITFLAEKYFKNQEYEKCIDELANIQLPFATYFQAEAYRKLNESNKTPKKNKNIYIEKAIDCLTQTQSLLNYSYTDPNHPLKSIVNSDIERLQQANKVDTSFAAANSSHFSDDLHETSATSTTHRYRREVVQVSNAEMENMLLKIMDTLKVVKEEVFNVKNEMAYIKEKVQTIEEQINKKQDSSNVDPNGVLDDYFLIDEELQNHGYLNNTPSMYHQSFGQQQQQQQQQRIQTPNQMHQQSALNMCQPQQQPQSQLPQQHLQQQQHQQQQHQQQQQQQQSSAIMNPYGSPFYNNLYPYQSAMMNAPPHQSMMLNNQRGVLPTAMGLPYADPHLTYPMHQLNALAAGVGAVGGAGAVTDPRNSVLGLLTQQPQPQIVPATTQHSLQLQQQQQSSAAAYQPANIQFQSGNQQVVPVATHFGTAGAVATTTTTTASNPIAPIVDDKPSSNVLKTFWNNAYNNAPVEKSPPINVVITNSDPLPIHTTAIVTQPALSVTIPSHHIKNPASSTEILGGSIGSGITAGGPLIGNTSTPESFKLKSSTEPFEKDTSVNKPKDATPKLPLFGNALGTTSFSTSKSTAFSLQPEKPKDDSIAKPNPFASFTFGSGATASTTAPTIGSDKPFAGIFSNLNQSKLTTDASLLGSVASAVAVVPKSPEPPAVNTTREDVDDYVPTAQFEPVIALPDLVEVVTGEENEIVKFEHKAKLLRFDKTMKEWKERGIGNMKILVNKDDPTKIRLLMRREQTHKLCCNQLLKSDMKFNPLPKIQSALSWYGQDFSENELHVELLAIRFKTVETCKQFHETILDVQETLLNGNVEKDEKMASTPATTTTTTTKPLGFGDQFKPKAGAWSCESCYLSNAAEATICAACNTSKVKVDTQITKDKNIPAAKPVDLTASKAVGAAATPADGGFGDKFKPKPGSWTCKGCYISNVATVLYCPACDTPKDDTIPKKEPKSLFANMAPTTTKFSFGIPATITTTTSAAAATTTTPAATMATTTNTFAFGTFTAMTKTNGGNNPFSTNPSKPTGFSLLSTPPTIKATTTTTTTAATPFSDVIPTLQPKESFSFVMKQKSPTKIKSPIKPIVSGVEDVSDDDHVEEEENNTYFTPVIPLPDKIDVKTGEEDEEILYSHRCKLYRFVEAEWKERGLGDVKILRHKESKKLRVLMRREQVLKICLNHILSDEVEYKVKDDKSWLFVVIDFSEGEIQPMKFCLRFKTKEIADGFKVAVDQALAGTAVPISLDSEPKTPNDNTVSAEDKKKAIDLQLPIEFFATKPEPCTGCRGCNPDDFVFPNITESASINNVPSKSDAQQSPLPLIMPPTTTTTPTKAVVKKSLFDSTATPTSTNATATKQWPMFFGLPSFSAQPNGTGSDSIKTPSVFGNANATAAKPLLFGEAKPSIFNTSNTVTSTTSTFQGFGKDASVPTGAAAAATPTTTVKLSAFSSENNDSNNKKTDDPNSAASFSFEKTFAASSLLGGATTNMADTKKDGETTTTTAATTTTTATINTSGSLFSGFGSNFTASSNTSGSIFGGLNSKSSAQVPSVEAQKNIFGGKFSSGQSIFGSASTAAGADSVSTTTTTTGLAGHTDSIFKVDPSLSFASIAAKSSPNAFKINNNDSTGSVAAAGGNAVGGSGGGSGFFGLTTKDDFSSFQPQTKENDTSKGENSLGGNATGDDNYDPHYEPIIPLPDEIVLTTGEEEEEKIFGERSKIFRYDVTNKEWKERGVGELKILFHPTKKCYRLLLRREQIFKCVVNQSITSDFVVSPMKASDTAYCWATNNFAEESNGDVEQLSARFKNSDLAQKFYKTIQNCISILKSQTTDIEPEED